MTTDSLRSTGLLLALLVASSLPAAAVDQDWASYRGPGGGGAAFEGALPDQAFGLASVWKRELGSGYSALSVRGDVVVAAFTSGEVDVLAALDAASGAERWRYELGPKYAGHDGSDDGPIATPAIAGDAVYAVGPHGVLVALGLADGAERWRVALEESNSTAPFYGYTTSPVVTDELVIVATGGEKHSLTAFDRASGAEQWAVGDDSVAYQTPSLLELGGQRVLIAATDFYLTALDPADGSIRWQVRHTEGGQGNESAHVTPLDGERFLLKLDDGARLYRVGANGAEELWRTRGFANSLALPVYHQGHFYGFTGNFLTCVRASDGEIVWRSRPPGGRGLSLVDGHLVVLDPDGNLVIARAAPDAYHEVTRLAALGNGDYAAPSFAAGTFYLRNLSEAAAVRVDAASAPQVADAAVEEWRKGELGKWIATIEALPAERRQAAVDERFATVERTPIVEAGGLAHFVFRGPVEDVGLTGDVAPQGENLGLHRVAGTDLFVRSLELDPAAQYGYGFTVDYGQRPQADPTNPHTVDNGFAVFSDLRMPEWPAAPHLDAPAADAPRGTLDGFPFRSETLDNTREIKVYRPTGYGDDPERRYPLLVVNHGDNVLRGQLMQNTLDNLVGTSVEPVVAVFVPRAAGPEYGGPGMEGYVQFLADELIPHLERHYRLDPARRAIMGPASAGVTAVWAALARPELFAKAAVQSYYVIEPADEKIAALLAADAPRPESVYVVWSRHDYAIDGGPTAEPATQALLERLRTAGVVVTEQIGTHSPTWAGWRGQDDDILVALFPLAAPDSTD